MVSDFLQSAEGLRNQRARCEHGHLCLIWREAPSILFQGLVMGDLGLLVLALDLCMPPLAMLTTLVGAPWILGAAAAASGGWWPLLLASITFALLGALIFASWAVYGRANVSPVQLLMVPGYILRKFPLYARFLFAKQAHWVRSNRDRAE